MHPCHHPSDARFTVAPPLARIIRCVLCGIFDRRVSALYTEVNLSRGHARSLSRLQKTIFLLNDTGSSTRTAKVDTRGTGARWRFCALASHKHAAAPHRMEATQRQGKW